METIWATIFIEITWFNAIDDDENILYIVDNGCVCETPMPPAAN